MEEERITLRLRLSETLWWWGLRRSDLGCGSVVLCVGDELGCCCRRVEAFQRLAKLLEFKKSNGRRGGIMCVPLTLIQEAECTHRKWIHRGVALELWIT